jgi:hypothetical protein
MTNDIVILEPLMARPTAERTASRMTMSLVMVISE